MIKQLHDITCVFEGLEGVGAIYISGITGAKNIQLLQKHNVKAVVCAARNGFLQYHKTAVEDYLYIPADDYEQFDLSQHFHKSYDFIEKNRKKTNVLVHCMAGISRSATLVVAYLIKKYGYSMNSILTLLKRKRTIINPNEGFLKQLKSFEVRSDLKDGRVSVKKLSNQKVRTHNYLSVKKQHQQYERKSMDMNKKRTMSRESKQFLESLRKNDNTPRTSIHKLKSLLQDDLKLICEKENHSHIPFTKQGFYSNQLGLTINVGPIKHEVTQLEINLQKQEQKSNLQSTVSSINLPSQTRLLSPQKTHTPLSQRLQAMKANLLQEYKLNKQNQNSLETLKQNESQKQIDVILAMKILNNKPKRYTERRR